jgi:hypothetical protein
MLGWQLHCRPSLRMLQYNCPTNVAIYLCRVETGHTPPRPQDQRPKTVLPMFAAQSPLLPLCLAGALENSLIVDQHGLLAGKLETAPFVDQHWKNISGD